MRINPAEVFTTEVEGQTVILNARTSLYLTTNPVGTFILSLLSDDLSESDVVKRVEVEYDVEPEIAAADCRAFLDKLREHDLVQG